MLELTGLRIPASLEGRKLAFSLVCAFPTQTMSLGWAWVRLSRSSNGSMNCTCWCQSVTYWTSMFSSIVIVFVPRTRLYRYKCDVFCILFCYSMLLVTRVLLAVTRYSRVTRCYSLLFECYSLLKADQYFTEIIVWRSIVRRHNRNLHNQSGIRKVTIQARTLVLRTG